MTENQPYLWNWKKAYELQTWYIGWSTMPRVANVWWAPQTESSGSVTVRVTTCRGRGHNVAAPLQSARRVMYSSAEQRHALWCRCRGLWSGTTKITVALRRGPLPASVCWVAAWTTARCSNSGRVKSLFSSPSGVFRTSTSWRRCSTEKAGNLSFAWTRKRLSDMLKFSWVGEMTEIGTWNMGSFAGAVFFCGPGETLPDHFILCLLGLCFFLSLVRGFATLWITCCRCCWSSTFLMHCSESRLSVHFNSHFPGELGLAGVYWS